MGKTVTTTVYVPIPLPNTALYTPNNTVILSDGQFASLPASFVATLIDVADADDPTDPPSVVSGLPTPLGAEGTILGILEGGAQWVAPSLPQLSTFGGGEGTTLPSTGAQNLPFVYSAGGSYLDLSDPTAPAFLQGGVYLITGGVNGTLADAPTDPAQSVVSLTADGFGCLAFIESGINDTSWNATLATVLTVSQGDVLTCEATNSTSAEVTGLQLNLIIQPLALIPAE